MTLEQLLDDLSNISKQKIILEPDIIIVGKLLDYEKLLPSDQTKINDELFEKIEKILIKLLYSNKAQLSFQCSIRIAECLLQLYQGSRQMKIYNLITTFNKRPEDPISYATGYILNKIGQHSKSVVHGIAKTLFDKMFPNLVSAKAGDKNAFPLLFVLSSCYKSSPRDMTSYLDKTMHLIRKFILIPNVPVQLLCITILIKMIKNGIITAERVIPIMTQLLQDQMMPYIIEGSCYLLAKLAYSQFKFSVIENEGSKSKETNNSTDSKKNQEVSAQMYCAFNIMENFKKHFDHILPRFLSLLEPDFIYANRVDIFTLVRRIDPSQLKHLISLLGADVKREFFVELAKEKLSCGQISILLMLAYDTNYITETGKLVYTLALQSNLKDRQNISLFFQEIVKKDPETTSAFLKRASKFLANPKSEEVENVDRAMRGIALIIASVLTVAPNRKQLIELIEENVVTFLRESWKSTTIVSPYFQPSFTILTVLPKRYIKVDEVDRLLSLYPCYLLSHPNMDDAQKMFTKSITETILLFLSVYPNFESTIPILECVLSRAFLKSHIELISIYNILPKLTETVDNAEYTLLANKLRELFIKTKPLQTFIIAITKSPFVTRTMILDDEKYEIPEKPARFLIKASSQEIVNSVYRSFADFFCMLPEEIKSNWINWLVVKNATLPMSHCIIITLINDKRTQKYLPANLHEVLFAVICSLDRLDRIQLGSEIIGLWAHLFPKVVTDQLFKKFSSPEYSKLTIENDDDIKRLRAKCFALASIFSHVPQLNDDVILNQMLELNNLIKTTEDLHLTTFGLYALATLFQSFPAQLSAMQFTDSQANFLLSLLNTKKSMDPFVLYHISRTFSSLLPIISPDIEKARPLAVPIVKMIIQLIKATPIPFCQQVFFYTMHSVFSFVKQYGDLFNMSFPVSNSINLSCKIEACQAFADKLIVESNVESAEQSSQQAINELQSQNFDFASLIPQCLMLLQRTEHKNPNMFIIAVATHFAQTALSQLIPRETSHNNSDSNTETKGISTDLTGDVIPRSFYPQIQEWTRLIKMCVSAGNLPIAGTVKIGASDTIKLCMLKVAGIILPLLLKTDPLLTESLDDLMTSFTRAVESHHPDIQNAAYPLIEQVVTDFGKIKNTENGQPIIGLYDIMFASAVKIGFYNLDVSGNFVLSFLNFHIDNIKKLLVNSLLFPENDAMQNDKRSIESLNSSYDEFVSILDYFVSGFKDCDHKTWHYHAIASKLTLISMVKSEFRKKFQEFFPRFAKDFSLIIFKAGKLWNEENTDEIELTRFRLNYSSFFSELLQSFVYINSYLDSNKKKKDEEEEEEEEMEERNRKPIKPKQFLTFLLSEITNGRFINLDELDENDCDNDDDTEKIEKWRLLASLKALGTFIVYGTTFFSQPTTIVLKLPHKFGAEKGKSRRRHKKKIQINGKMLSNAIQAISICYDHYDDLIKPILPGILRSVSECLSIFSSSIANLEMEIEKQKEINENIDENDALLELMERYKIETQLRKESWKRLVAILVDENFDAQSLCYLIKNGGNELISQYSINFVELILDNFASKQNTDENSIKTSIALCTMLFYVADDKLEELFDFALGIKYRRNAKKKQFKFEFLKQIFKFLPINDTNYNRNSNQRLKASQKTKKVARRYAEKICDLIWNNFQDGGSDLLVELLCDHPYVAENIMLSEDATAYYVSILDEKDSLISYIDFVMFVLTTKPNDDLDFNFNYIQINDDYLNQIIRFALRVIIQWEEPILSDFEMNETTKSKKKKEQFDEETKQTAMTLVFKASQILKLISVNSQPLVRIVFKAMAENFQTNALKAVFVVAKRILDARAEMERRNGAGAKIQLNLKKNANERTKRKMDSNSDDDSDWQDLEVVENE